MSARAILPFLAAAFLAFVGGCATADRTVANQDDPMLQKSDDHPVHGEASVFYGRSVGN